MFKRIQKLNNEQTNNIVLFQLKFELNIDFIFHNEIKSIFEI